jgi:hypothetical protein
LKPERNDITKIGFYDLDLKGYLTLINHKVHGRCGRLIYVQHLG